MRETITTSLGRTRKSLSLWNFFNIGFGAVNGSCWLLLVGEWFVEGGGPTQVVVAFVFGLVLMIPIGAVFGELSGALPFSGGSIAFVERTYGRTASWAIGWLLMLGNIVIPMWDALMVSVVLSATLGGGLGPAVLPDIPLYEIAGAKISLIPVLITIAIVAGIGALNVKRPSTAMRLQFGLSIVQLAGMSIALAVALIYGAASNALPAFAQVSTNYGSVTTTTATTPVSGMATVLTTITFFYAGFETIALRADEADEGVNWNKFGKVIILVLLASACFFVASAYAFGTMLPWRSFIQLPTPALSALRELSPGAYAAMVVVALCCPLGPINAFIGAASTTMLMMARREQLPARFAQLDPTTASPAAATAVVSVISCVGPFLGAGMLTPLSKVASFSLTLAYLVVALACLHLRRSEPALRRPFRVPGGIPGVVWACAASAICLLLLIWPTSPSALGLAEWLLLGLWVCVWLAAMLYARRRTP